MSVDAGLYKKIRIQKIAAILKDFKVFTLDYNTVHYQAGQYLTLVHLMSDIEIRRSYSMTTCPGVDKEISIGVKRVPNGFFSRILIDHSNVGDELLTIGAGGRFVLPEQLQDQQHIFFFAAGTGITPIYSLIKQCLYIHSKTEVTLVYSNHTEASTIFKKELEALQSEFTDRFEIVWLFSNTANLKAARLHRDYLIRLVTDLSRSKFKDSLYYLCGPLSYMRMCSFVLHEMNVPTENIRKENFLIAQPPPVISLPPDRDLHSAVIHFRGTNHSIPVHFPDSILQAAKKTGLILPYSCETGRCANCVARCIAGRIWLSHNEVLTEKDIAMGLTLTCVGHPVGGDVEISID